MAEEVVIMQRAFRLTPFALCIAMTGWAQAPRIDALDRAQGPIAGGTVVTIRRASLARASVTIDSNSVAFTQVSSAELRFTAPKHDNGYALVKAGAGAAYAELLYVPPKLEELRAAISSADLSAGGSAQVSAATPASLMSTAKVAPSPAAASAQVTSTNSDSKRDGRDQRRSCMPCTALAQQP